MALELGPGDDQLLAQKSGDDDHDDGVGITLKDVEKVIYRRAAAFSALNQLDEGIADAQRVLRLNPGNQPAAKLLTDLKARVSSLQSRMAERLKKAF